MPKILHYSPRIGEMKSVPWSKTIVSIIPNLLITFENMAFEIITAWPLCRGTAKQYLDALSIIVKIKVFWYLFNRGGDIKSIWSCCHGQNSIMGSNLACLYGSFVILYCTFDMTESSSVYQVRYFSNSMKVALQPTSLWHFYELIWGLRGRHRVVCDVMQKLHRSKI